MAMVFDASLTLAIAFNEPGAEITPSLLRRIAREGAVVPALWRWEVANGLALALQRGRALTADIERFLVDFSTLPIPVDDLALDRAWTVTVALAVQHRLTAYDAAYLEVALRHALPLATLDKALARAARDEGIEVSGAST